jgi:hypothetical protein
MPLSLRSLQEAMIAVWASVFTAWIDVAKLIG